MAGEPDNAHIWADADVYVAFDLDAPTPDTIDDPFGAEWDLVGLLDGDDGFVTSRSEDRKEYPAWGQGVIRTSYRNAKESHSFTALEDNATTRRLINRGEVDDGVLIVPSGQPERVRLAFETTDGDGLRRKIYDTAEIVVDGDVKENETDLSSVKFTATIYTDDDGVSGVEQDNVAASV